MKIFIRIILVLMLLSSYSEAQWGAKILSAKRATEGTFSVRYVIVQKSVVKSDTIKYVFTSIPKADAVATIKAAVSVFKLKHQLIDKGWNSLAKKVYRHKNYIVRIDSVRIDSDVATLCYVFIKKSDSSKSGTRRLDLSGVDQFKRVKEFLFREVKKHDWVEQFSADNASAFASDIIIWE